MPEDNKPPARKGVIGWVRTHPWIVGAGLAGLAVFLYLYFRSLSSSGSNIIASTPPASGTSGGAGALNLSSGNEQNLPGNLQPPNCGPGMVPVPTIVNGGAGQPGFLVGWTCQPIPGNPTPPPPAPTPPPPAPPPPAPTPAPPQRGNAFITVCNWPNWCGSLWGITQHLTGNGSLWPILYGVIENRNLIGGNPNLIHPGQQLRIPCEVPAFAGSQECKAAGW